MPPETTTPAYTFHHHVTSNNLNGLKRLVLPRGLNLFFRTKTPDASGFKLIKPTTGSVLDLVPETDDTSAEAPGQR